MRDSTFDSRVLASEVVTFLELMCRQDYYSDSRLAESNGISFYFNSTFQVSKVRQPLHAVGLVVGTVEGHPKLILSSSASLHCQSVSWPISSFNLMWISRGWRIAASGLPAFATKITPQLWLGMWLVNHTKTKSVHKASSDGSFCKQARHNDACHRA